MIHEHSFNKARLIRTLEYTMHEWRKDGDWWLTTDGYDLNVYSLEEFDCDYPYPDGYKFAVTLYELEEYETTTGETKLFATGEDFASYFVDDSAGSLKLIKKESK